MLLKIFKVQYVISSKSLSCPWEDNFLWTVLLVCIENNFKVLCTKYLNFFVKLFELKRFFYALYCPILFHESAR